jgi:UTP--glucose-1-phosphate uridylyltransferase
MKITKAIIPVAGWGTRRLPITKVIEKCMLPIGNRPVVDYIVQDCIKAGITDFYFVVSSENSQLEAYYSRNEALEEYLKANGKDVMLPLIAPPQVNFHFVVQPNDGKYGTAIPVGLCVPFVEPDESVVVMMGDDCIYMADGSSQLEALMKVTSEGGCSLLGVEVPRERVYNYGVLKFDEQQNFEAIIEHPKVEDAPSNLINISKYILNYSVLQRIEEFCTRQKSDEYLIVEPINDYVTDGGVVKVVPASGAYLDAGTVEGWVEANRLVIGG